MIYRFELKVIKHNFIHNLLKLKFKKKKKKKKSLELFELLAILLDMCCLLVPYTPTQKNL